MMEKIPNTEAKLSVLLDYPFEMWFRYRLRYRPKVSANLGFSFGIGPKPKHGFRSYTSRVVKSWTSFIN